VLLLIIFTFSIYLYRIRSIKKQNIKLEKTVGERTLELFEKNSQLGLEVQERKQAEEKLRIAEETYRNIFLDSPIGLFRTDMDTGLLLDSNDALAHFIGFDNRDQMLAKPFNIAERYVDPHDREKMISLLKEDGSFQDFEARFRKNDSSIILMKFSAKLRRDKGWLEGVSEDITERKQAEKEILTARERLSITNSILRHDITNDLAVIKSAVNLFRNSNDGTMLDEILKRVNKGPTAIRSSVLL